jgi:hypothetical protein
MKKVVSPENVAHLWANKIQDEARTSNSNLYFNNDKIYSYGSHFCIASHVINENRDRATLFTTRSYSNTTAKHINTVRGAANHLNLIYCPYPAGDKYENLEYWIKEAEQIGPKLAKAKKPELYLNQLDQLRDKIEKYSNFIGFDYKELKPELAALLAVTNKDEFIKYAEIKESAIKEREAKRQSELKKEHAKQLRKFRDFKTNSLYVRNGMDYLRYNADKKRIETSQNVEIPEGIAKRFFNWLIKINKSGGCLNCECGQKIMQYSVEEVNKDFVRIGCHKIAFTEINRTAKQLNWL